MNPAETPPGDRTQPLSRRYARFVLGMLMLVYVLNMIDRQVLSILMEPIRKDLGLTDTQLGLLSGLSFALFYAMAGLPIARLADVWSRRNVIAASLAIWSGMTAICGLAASFPQLLLARIGVAVGEGGSGPAAHSMIADLFPEGKRSTALAVFSTGVPIGILIGLISGGWLNDAFNWRTAFVVVGLPGLVVSLLFLATVREPPRTASSSSEPPAGTLGEALRSLWRLRPFKYLTLAAACHAFTAYAALQWNASYLVRDFHLTTREAGLALGLLTGLTGIVGTLAGGWLADRLGRSDPRWYARLPALLLAIGLPFYLAAYLWAPSATAVLALLLIPNMLGNSYAGPTFAAVQTLTPVRTRAFAAAVLLFIISMIGLGLGPLMVGAASDMLRPSLGGQALGHAIALAGVGEVLSVVLYMVAARDLDHEFGRPAPGRSALARSVPRSA